MGDTFLVEFESALEATLCAIDVQSSINSLSLEQGENTLVRIGVHVGDVVHEGGDVLDEGGDVLGDAVNVTSRIEPLAPPGGICVSRQIYDQVRGKISYPLLKLEPREVKNVKEQVEVYSIVLPWQEKMDPISGHQRPDARRVAVLPLVSLSPDPNDEYFADGLTEELISRLSQVGGLEVIARTSAMNYKKKEKSVSQIGRELNVGTVMEGSVRKSGNRIRVTVQLINSATEGHLWSSRYDRDLEDIFAVQSEIAESVASSLKVKLLEEDKNRLEKGGTRDAKAHILLLKGAFQLRRWDLASIKSAIGYFEEAIARDEGYAIAYVRLSQAYGKLGFMDLMDQNEVYRKAEGYARKALGMDESIADAHVALAIALINNYDFVGCDRELERALELNPNSTLARCSSSFAFFGRWEGCLREVDRALELDPLSVSTTGSAGTWHLYAGNYDQAIAYLKDALELDPKSMFHLDNLGLAYVRKGMVEEGLELIRRAADATGSPGEIRDLAYAYVKAGRRAEAEELLAKLLKSSASERAHSAAIAGVYAVLGEKDQSFVWLERAYKEKSGYLAALKTDFVFETLRDDPRFHVLISKLGLDS